MAFKLPQLPHLGPRTRKIVRYTGITLLGIVTFVFAVQMTLPIERAKDKVIEMLSPSYDVTIGSVERGFIPGRVYLKAVSLRSRPTTPGETPTVIYIDKVKADVGLLALIGATISVDFDAAVGNGHISGNVSALGFGNKGLDLHIKGRDLPASNLPMRGLLGLPMSGKLEFTVAMDIPKENTKTHVGWNWQKAEGDVEVGCPSGCTFGDGKTKLKPLLKNRSQQVMVQDGIDFGKVDLDSLLARVDIKNGNLDVSKFEIKSPDGEVHVDYHMKLEPELGDSIVTGCLRFKGTPLLEKKEPKTFAALQTTGAELRNDGLFHIKLADRFKDMKRLNAECGPNAPKEDHEPNAGTINTGIGGPRPTIRPNLTVTPQEVNRPENPPPPAAAAQPPVAPQGMEHGSGGVPTAPGQGTAANPRGMERERPPGPEGEQQPQPGSAQGSEVAPGSGTPNAGNPPPGGLQ